MIIIHPFLTVFITSRRDDENLLSMLAVPLSLSSDINPSGIDPAGIELFH